ncbi:MAG TPA: peroxiredoxin [Gammaproteobacteria bacterium]|nr:peroxiredoxin [Gammaproteobacteria bacterium]
MRDLYVLPDDLPVPEDDGACDHLEGEKLPSLSLEGTAGRTVDLSSDLGITVVCFYPLLGRPDAPPMIGWNEIPGARGCTPQSCAFRDRHSELRELGVKVYGVSAQPLADQKEAVERLGLPFELLNDSALALAHALSLPTFEYESLRLIKRLTLVAVDGVIRKVFYPVFPPHRNPDDVIAWLRAGRI